MKYLKRFENVENNETIDWYDFVKVKKTGEVGIIISKPIVNTPKIKVYTSSYYGVLIDDKVIEYTIDDIEKITPEEAELYDSEKKYNL